MAHVGDLQVYFVCPDQGFRVDTDQDLERRREQAWLADSAEDEAWLELERDLKRREKAARECGVDVEGL